MLRWQKHTQSYLTCHVVVAAVVGVVVAVRSLTLHSQTSPVDLTSDVVVVGLRHQTN